MIDRGGLRYEIDVVVRNLKALRQFRKELRATLRASQASSAEQVKAARRSAQVAEANERIKRSVIKTRIEETRLAAARQRLAASTNAAHAAQARYAAAVFRAAASQQRAAAAATANAEATRRAGIAATVAARRKRGLARSSDRATAAGNRMSFTFRRLFGILFAFQAARLGLQGFGGLVRSGIAFNDTIENARIGIAGLITATGILKDEQGKVLRGAEAYAAALQVSEGVVDRIRTRALETTATTTELLEAVQIAIGPGLAAGLDLSQVEDVAVLISQAATALRVPQNQLGEEIRSVLAGTARQQTTRLVAAFGGNATQLNENIRLASEQGRLFEFLTNKLTPFAKAAEQAAQTFSGLTQRLRDAVGVAAGAASEGLFDELKLTLREIFGILTDDSGEFIEASADAAVVLFPIMEGLRLAVADVRDGLKEITFEEAVLGAEAIGQSIRVLARVAVALFRGMAQGIALVVGGLKLVAEGFDSVDGGQFDELLVTIATVFTVLVSVRSAIGLLSFALKPVIGIFAKLAVAVRIFVVSFVKGLIVIVPLLFKMSVAMAKFVLGTTVALAQLLLFPLIVVGVVALFKLLIDRLTGTNLKLVTIAKLLKEGIVNGSKVAVQSIVVFFAKITNEITGLIVKSFNFLLTRVESFLRAVAVGLDKLPGINGDAVRAAARLISGAQAGLRTALSAGNTNVANQIAKLEALKRQFDSNLGAIISQDKSAPELTDLIKDAIASAVRIVKDQLPPGVEDALGRLGIGLEQLIRTAVTGGADELAELKDRINGVIDGDVVNVDSLVASIKEALEKGGEAALQQRIDVLRSIQDSSKTLLKPEAVLNLEERIAKLRGNNRAAEIGASRARIAQLQTETRILEEQAKLKVQPFDAQIDQLKAREGQFQADTPEGVLLATQINQLLAQRNLIAAEFREKLVAANEELRKLGDGSLTAGFIAGMEEIVENFDEFQLGAQLANQAAASFADNLFAVVEGTKTVGDAIKDFFKGLVKTIISELVKLAVAKAVVGIAGIHEGGLIVGSHSDARGYNSGGNVIGPRPKGLHPADTVPAWLQPREFVQPVKSVDYYGSGVMEAIRQRLIPAGLLRTLASIGGANLPRPRIGAVGFREGGSVSKRTTTGRRASSGGAGTINSRAVVDDGLTGDTLRVVGPGIKQPRNVAEQQGVFQ